MEDRSLAWMAYYGIGVDLPYDLEYGQYNFVVKFEGNEQYKPFEDTVPFNVSYKFVPFINGNNYLSYDLEYGDIAYLDVFLPYGTYGDLNVTYGGKKQKITVFDGSANCVIDGLLLGTHELVMEYGDSIYPYKKVVRSINVSPVVSIPDTVIYGDDAVITLSMNDDANGNITVSIDGSEIYNRAVLNGKAEIPLEGSDLGSREVIIAYVGDDYSFNQIEKQVNFIPKVIAPVLCTLMEVQ